MTWFFKSTCDSGAPTDLVESHESAARYENMSCETVTIVFWGEADDE